MVRLKATALFFVFHLPHLISIFLFFTPTPEVALGITEYTLVFHSYK